MKEKEMNKFIPIILAVILVFSLTVMAGCKAESGGSATEAEWSISVTDAGGKTVEFTNADAGKLEMVEIEANLVKKDGSEVSIEDGLVQLVAAALPGSFWIKNVAKISAVN